VLIRPATTADLSLIRALEQQADTAAHWSERDYEALFAPDTPKRITLIASETGEAKLLGFVIAHCSSDQWEIENIVVAPEHRRRRIGRALLREMLDLARELGAKSVLLEVRDSNAAARQFYAGFGFAEVARRRAYYRDPEEDALLLNLSIAKDEGLRAPAE